MKREFRRREVPAGLNMRLAISCMNWNVSCDVHSKLCLSLVADHHWDK